LSLPFGIQPSEALIILLIIILLIWGPTKLPQLARAIGKAFYEFRRASQGLIEDEEVRKVKEGKVDEETLKRIAEKLGIETEGKPREKIIEEIVREAERKGLLEQKR
jgi:sec-independent protein translocase protein TatA